MNHWDTILLGLLGSAFFALLWRRLDSIDRRLEKVGDEVHILIGRVDEISKHV